jgi:hypothetical protein
MSNTDILRHSEAALLPEGFIVGHTFSIRVQGYDGLAEVDGYNPETCEAIEICQSEAAGESPKPGQKRKLASDVLKLIFLKQLGYISRGRVFVTSPEMYTWCNQKGSWLNAARKYYGVSVELRAHDSKTMRKKIRHVLATARRER